MGRRSNRYRRIRTPVTTEFSKHQRCKRSHTPYTPPAVRPQTKRLRRGEGRNASKKSNVHCSLATAASLLALMLTTSPPCASVTCTAMVVGSMIVATYLKGPSPYTDRGRRHSSTHTLGVNVSPSLHTEFTQSSSRPIIRMNSCATMQASTRTCTQPHERTRGSSHPHRQ